MRSHTALILAMLLPFAAGAKDVTRSYTFPGDAYTITFPCIGKLETSEAEEKTYDLHTANMFCDEKDQTYTVQYFKFHNIPGMEKASLQDKHYFLREFRDMVRKFYMGDYDDFLTEDEGKASVLGLPALRFNLVSEKKDYAQSKIAAQAVLDGNSALYFSSIFVKDRENNYNIKEFFESLKIGSKKDPK